MKANNIEIQSLQRLRCHYPHMLDNCSDAIKGLTGYTPENATLVFNISNTSIVSIPVCEENANFCVGFFMSWHQYYNRKLKETAVLLDSLTAKIAV